MGAPQSCWPSSPPVSTAIEQAVAWAEATLRGKGVPIDEEEVRRDLDWKWEADNAHKSLIWYACEILSQAGSISCLLRKFPDPSPDFSQRVGASGL
jgi:hypothetical protein